MFTSNNLAQSTFNCLFDHFVILYKNNVKVEIGFKN